MKKGIKIAAGVVVGLGVIGALAGGNGDDPKSSPANGKSATVAQVTATQPADSAEVKQFDKVIDDVKVIFKALGGDVSGSTEKKTITVKTTDENFLYAVTLYKTDEEIRESWDKIVSLLALTSEQLGPEYSKYTLEIVNGSGSQLIAAKDGKIVYNINAGIIPDTITAGEKNALKKAESYLRYSSFSKKGLIDQLKFEGFTTEESTYAVNNVKVDWMEQAVLKAKSYLKYSSFSKQGLVDQLKFEGFTTEQAEYGVSKAY